MLKLMLYSVCLLAPMLGGCHDCGPEDMRYYRVVNKLQCGFDSFGFQHCGYILNDGTKVMLEWRVDVGDKLYRYEQCGLYDGYDPGPLFSLNGKPVEYK